MNSLEGWTLKCKNSPKSAGGNGKVELLDSGQLVEVIGRFSSYSYSCKVYSKRERKHSRCGAGLMSSCVSH